MKLYYDKRLADPTYYAQIGIRNGSKTTTRNVKKFGKHSELLKITDDPLAYVKEEIARMNEESRVGKVSYELTADFNERVPRTSDDASHASWLNIGYFIIQSIMSQLDLKTFFQKCSSDRRVTFDCYTINRFLTYSRIMDPRSKHSVWDHLDTYYEQPDFAYQHILRFMDVLAENDTQYLEWLFTNSQKIVKRDTSVLYYDCSNFYFECEQEDDEVVDEVTGEIISGLRKYGISKEHRPNPIVEMGLFIDRRGIPITMSIHSGNMSEQLTAVPLENEVKKMIGKSKFIYCADAGLGSLDIRRFNSMGGRAFVVTQSIKKLGVIYQEAIFSDIDYRLLSSNSPVTIKHMKEFDRFDSSNRQLYEDRAYKIIPADRLIDLGLYETKPFANGSTRKVKAKGTLPQKLIVTFSRKLMEYQRSVRQRQIERAKNILKSNDPEEIKKGPNDVRRFMKRVVSTKTGEKASVTYALDMDKIAEEEKYDGYYALATNLDDDVKDVLGIAGGRNQIESCFRIMKTDMSACPVNHRLPPRIKAHFLICYTGLLVARLLQCKLEDQETCVTIENLIETLRNMNVVNVHDMEFMSIYKGSSALDALVRMTELPLDRMHYRPKDLNKLIKKFLK